MALPERSGKVAGGFGRVLVRFWEVRGEVSGGMPRRGGPQARRRERITLKCLCLFLFSLEIRQNVS